MHRVCVLILVNEIRKDLYYAIIWQKTIPQGGESTGSGVSLLAISVTLGNLIHMSVPLFFQFVKQA